jgi:hypothetical protein
LGQRLGGLVDTVSPPVATFRVAFDQEHEHLGQSSGHLALVGAELAGFEIALPVAASDLDKIPVRVEGIVLERRERDLGVFARDVSGLALALRIERNMIVGHQPEDEIITGFSR